MLSVTTARVVGTILTAATFPFLVRRLGVDMYGLWSYVVAVCGFTALLANPGLTTYAAQQVAARRKAAFETISDVLILRLLAAGVAAIAVVIVARFEPRPDVRMLLTWYGIASVFTGSVSLDYLLSSLELFHVQSSVSIVQQSLYAVGIFTMVRSPKDVIWVPVSILGSSFLTSVVAWFVLWRQGYRFRFSIAPRRWGAILNPSLHYAGSALMSNLYHRSGHLAVRWYLGEHALGLYAAAARLADVLRNFLSVTQNVLMPRMALAGEYWRRSLPAHENRVVDSDFVWCTAGGWWNRDCSGGCSLGARSAVSGGGAGVPMGCAVCDHRSGCSTVCGNDSLCDRESSRLFAFDVGRSRDRGCALPSTAAVVWDSRSVRGVCAGRAGSGALCLLPVSAGGSGGREDSIAEFCHHREFGDGLWHCGS